MTNKVLEGCKKYVIERVVNPSLFWMTEYERGTCYKDERKDVYLSSRDVEEYTGSGKIPVGELIAVKDERKFLRGLVMDSYNRNSEREYRVSLLEYGKVIGIKQSEIYLIKNEKSGKKKLNVVKVAVHGIQPAAMEIQYETNFLGEIFKKRVCHNWSADAFRFVRDLVLKNPCVFVKAVHNEKRLISGDIYFLQEPGSNEVPVDLGQILCAKGFAVFSDARLKLNIQSDTKGANDNNIEEKIPDAALFRGRQKREVKKKIIVENVKKSENKVSDLMESRISSVESSRAFEMSSSSTCSSSCTISENENSESRQHLTFNTSSDSYSSSWILKKCHRNTSTPLSGRSFRRENIYESEQTKRSSPENPKVSIFRVIERSLEFFDKEKQRERFCHN